MNITPNDIQFLIEVAIVPLIVWFYRYLTSRIKDAEDENKSLKQDLKNFYTKQETDRIIAIEIRNIDEKLGHIKELFLHYVNNNK